MDDEIVIGIDVKEDSNNKKPKKDKKNKKVKEKQKEKSKANKNKKDKNNSDENNPKIRNKIAIIFLIIAILVILFGSSLFNIKNIVIVGNQKISQETVISLSGLELYKNIFKF